MSKVATLHVLNAGKAADLERAFDARLRLIIKGLIISVKLRNLLQDSILLRYKLGYKIEEGMKSGILLLINLAKKMEEAINGRQTELMLELMIKYAGLDISKRVHAVYQGFKNVSKVAGKNTICAALKLNYTALKHYPTSQRKMILSLTNSFLMTKGILGGNDVLKFNELSWQYDLITNAKEYFKEFLGCSFSYWIRDMMQDFLETMATSDGSHFRLQIFLNSLEDSKDLLNNSIHLNSPTELIDEYRRLTVKYMNQKFMNSLSNRISDDLLVQSHHFYMVYELAKPNPYDNYDGDMNILMKLRNVVVLDRIINVKELAELSLSEKLYNRAIMSNQNFQIYEV